MRRSVKSSTASALLLFAGALYSFYWVQSRGAFDPKVIQIPIRLTEGASIEIPFSVAERGAHYLEVKYPMSASANPFKDLNRITGQAQLRSNGDFLLETKLPVYHLTSNGYSDAMVVFTFEGKPYKKYTVFLRFDQLPSALKDAEATLQVEIDHHQYKLFGVVLILSLVLATAGVIYSIPMIRWLIGRKKAVEKGR